MSKKKEEQPPRVLLGRPGNHLKIGIVGLPNVGKSTLFSILTKMNVPAENFPFCTIDPNESRVAVPDERFEWLCEHWKPLSKVPAYLEVIDIAGLVRGAAEGQGLGNAFLSHIKAVDGIYHVIRIFEDVEITHVEGALDPIRDLEIISNELLLKDIEYLEKAVASMEKIATKVDKTKKAEFEIMKKVQDWVAVQKKQVRHGDWKPSEVEVINTLFLLTAKPVIFLVNMSELDYLKKKSKWLPKIKQWVDEHGGEPIIPFCAKIEGQFAEMTPEQSEQFTKEKGVTASLPKIVRTGYHHLELIYFFTAGKDEVRCWTIRNGTKAPQAAGVIHTDFERGFICAEVMKFEDYKEAGSEGAAKAAGKYLQQGKNYTVVDGDIIFFKFNAGAGLAAAKKK